MSFNIFGPSQKSSVKVGYISTERGYIDGVTICEANQYAQKNPGTQFIFKTRNIIKYLNINEVNKLTPDDALVEEKTCEGVVIDKECGPAEVFFYGGGGVGVQGNPIIGSDGSLLGVDLVAGGFGYQYPPIVDVKDSCGIGAGAVITAVLGEVVETVEYYDQEGDFEDYNFELCPPDAAGYGLRYGPGGEVLGKWDPSLYANLSKDPIQRQIKEYQDFLQQLQKPWWTTRKENPLRVTSANRTSRIKHNVTHPGWSDFLNEFAISPVPPSNAPGSDFAGQEFQMEWEEEFPYDGEYVFRAQADNLGRFYLDNEKLIETTQFKQDKTPKLVKKNVTAGVHRIRIDLYNEPQYEKVVTQSKSSTQTEGTQVKRVFNTVDYIDKADRKLWRLDPRAGRDSAFINQYGILPFNPNSTEAQSESFSGTHVIRWETIDFPIDGNYNIEVMVDDDVTLYIGNSEGNGRVAIGNGLRDVREGGDEVIIRKRGYSSPGKSTGKSIETRYFKAGKYRIRAELEQINVGPLAKGNPMALAVNIEASFVEKNVVSARSWNENPMGATLTIDAPMPPIPQEPIPLQDGRCPRNPMWTTRFPGANEKWWPVNFTNKNPNEPSWSLFMNRFAISPVPPLSTPGSDSGGIVYKNSWNLDIPYDGFYALKATVDNAGRILIDNKPVMQANYIPTNLRNTRGGSGAERRSGIDAIDGGVIFNWRESNPKAKKIFLTKGFHKIEVEVENGVTETFKKIDKKVFSTKDWLFRPKVVETQVQTAVPGRDEYELVEDIYRGTTTPGPRIVGQRPSGMRGGGNIPVTAPANATFFSNGYGPWYLGTKLNIKEQVGGSGNIAAPDWGLDTDPYKKYHQWDENTRLTLGKFKGDEWGIKVWKRKSVAPTTTTTTTRQVSAEIVNQSPTAAGLVYEGPTPIANYRGDFISPVLQDVNATPNEEVQGKTWIFRWSNVDFPVDGQYTLESEADDNLIVRVDGVQVGRSKVFEGRAKTKFNASKGKRTIELELSNIRIPDTGFDKNPVVGFAEITVPVDTATGLSQPWTINPMGISAVLIPPPCPRVVKGKGVVTRVDVDDPGNSYPPPAGPGYPVALRLESVKVLDPGINHNCGVDRIVIEPDNGAVLDYECDSFGRINNVKVLNPGLGFTRYPDIRMITDTGINATFAPQFEVVRDPIVIDPEKLIQVTDLVGLEKTGYVDGRAYYGAVFYKEGVRYAGFYETPGELVQVYDTLQESIDAQVTTPPSAIQRQGTSVRTNNPTLNIPNTPDEII